MFILPFLTSAKYILKDAKAAEKAAKKQKALDKEAARLKEAAEKSQSGGANKSKKAATKDAKVRRGQHTVHGTCLLRSGNCSAPSCSHNAKLKWPDSAVKACTLKMVHHANQEKQEDAKSCCANMSESF